MGRLRASILAKRKLDPEVSALIEIANSCELMGALPYEGGVLDQDHLLMRKILMVHTVRAEKRELDRKKPK